MRSPAHHDVCKSIIKHTQPVLPESYNTSRMVLNGPAPELVRSPSDGDEPVPNAVQPVASKPSLMMAASGGPLSAVGAALGGVMPTSLTVLSMRSFSCLLAS